MGRYAQETSSFLEVITSPKARKAQVAIIGVLLSLVTAGLIPPHIGIWITTIVSALVAAGVYQLPNANQTLVVVPKGEAETPDVVVEVAADHKIENIAAATYQGDVRG